VSVFCCIIVVRELELSMWGHVNSGVRLLDVDKRRNVFQDMEKSSVLIPVNSTSSLTSYHNFNVVHPIVFKSSVALGNCTT
jgi:hypothetical protein